MKKYAIGLMSGTSLDGLDICYASFTYADKWDFEIIKAETIPYNSVWEDRLKNAFYSSAEDLMELHSDYGFYLGEQVLTFKKKHHVSKLDVIASHGHTIYHQPQRKFTTQIGDGRAIKIVTSTTTIYDFRTQDVLLGGNGAPLVPIGDHLLFSEYDACVNLGGFSNISFQKNNQRIAFDICPVNIILNLWSNQLGLAYDKDGSIAAKGTINTALLQRWNDLPFYQMDAPKSLGLEWINENIIKDLPDLDPETLIATATEHAAIQIANVLIKYNLKNVLFTGGGTYNKYLIKRIETLASAEYRISNPYIIDFKEALIFAFMGVLKVGNENNVLSSATGAKFDHSTGLIV